MMKPLEYVLDEMIEQEEEIVNRPFMVIDLATAAEAQRRITYFNERMEEINEISEKQIAPFLAKIEKIREWGAQAKQEYIDKSLNYEVLLESYIRNEIAEQVELGKKPKKSIKLPYGTIALKKQQPEYQKDEEELLEYAKTFGWVRIKEETNWSELKKNCSVHEGRLYDENGQLVPGVSVVEREDRFELKLDGR